MHLKFNMPKYETDELFVQLSSSEVSAAKLVKIRKKYEYDYI